jgi:hypothetical protein
MAHCIKLVCHHGLEKTRIKKALGTPKGLKTPLVEKGLLEK